MLHHSTTWPSRHEVLQVSIGVQGQTVAFSYSRFQVTFHCKIPNFVAKFGNSLRSSKFISEFTSRVCKLSIWLASLSSGANHSLCLQTSLWILKWTSQRTSELRNEVRIRSSYEVLHIINKYRLFVLGHRRKHKGTLCRHGLVVERLSDHYNWSDWINLDMIFIRVVFLIVQVWLSFN